MSAPVPMVGCAGSCGREIQSAAVEKSGWSYLHITGRWRCGACERDLARAAHADGAPARVDADTLPPHSIGALKKLPESQPLHEKVKP